MLLLAVLASLYYSNNQTIKQSQLLQGQILVLKKKISDMSTSSGKIANRLEVIEQQLQPGVYRLLASNKY